MGYGETTSPEIERIAREIVDCALTVHRALGPGLLESTYEACIQHELTKRGFTVRRQVLLPIVYDGLRLDDAYRIDLLVNDLVIIEVKAVEQMSKVFGRQIRTYLRLSGCSVGFLINFNVELIKDGMQRVVLSKVD